MFDRIRKKLTYTSVKCPSCGAGNTVQAGHGFTCAYCGAGARLVKSAASSDTESRKASLAKILWGILVVAAVPAGLIVCLLLKRAPSLAVWLIWLAALILWLCVGHGSGKTAYHYSVESMPLYYGYRCATCGRSFRSRYQARNNQPMWCPDCRRAYKNRMKYR